MHSSAYSPLLVLALTAPVATACLSGAQRYVGINKTLSCGAERDTIVFGALAFLTGSFGADTAIPGGKIADFFGFQFFRDVDASNAGHTKNFQTATARNVLYTLTSAQRGQLVALAYAQDEAITSYVNKRYELISGFRRQLAGDLPSGSSGIDRSSVMQAASDLYSIDGQLGYERAVVYAGIINSFTATQESYLNTLVSTGSLTWPSPAEASEVRGLPSQVKARVYGFASDIFSWYGGNVTSDVYFAPERQAMYFGNFYLKDAPTIADPGASHPGEKEVSQQVFAALPTANQKALLTSLVSAQDTDWNMIVDVRTTLCAEFRKLLAVDAAPDSSVIQSYAKLYGMLDGEISYLYIVNFAALSQTLDDATKTSLQAIRDSIYSALPTGAYYLFNPVAMPTVPSTDYLFFPTTTPTRRQRAAEAAARLKGSVSASSSPRRLRGEERPVA